MSVVIVRNPITLCAFFNYLLSVPLGLGKNYHDEYACCDYGM